MISIYPSFFPDFRCKEDRCVKSCCADPWDIAVDDKTAKMYFSWDTPLGKEIQRHLRHDKEGWHIKEERGVCPFFENGLCRIVKAKGEKALGYICHVHPRFYTYIGDYELSGTGLCCERTCEQIEEAGTLRFHADGHGSLLSFQDVLALFGLDVPKQYLEFTPDPDRSYYAHIAERLEPTDPLDQEWTKELQNVKNHLPETAEKAKSYSQNYPKPLFTAFYQYILYRALVKALTYPIEAVMDYASEMAEWIFIMSALGSDPLEAAARWSKQIEYDSDNMDILLQGLSGPAKEEK